METEGKTEELVKQFKTCERNMQELINSIKRPNLRIMGIEEEEVQAKGMHNIFNKIIAVNFQKNQTNAIHYHITISTNTECQGTPSFPIKKTPFGKLG
jgi:esterase/lipase